MDYKAGGARPPFQRDGNTLSDSEVMLDRIGVKLRLPPHGHFAEHARFVRADALDAERKFLSDFARGISLHEHFEELVLALRQGRMRWRGSIIACNAQGEAGGDARCDDAASGGYRADGIERTRIARRR